MARQQDIAGFRRSHKKIPTRMAMDNDQAELAAKQRAVGSMRNNKSAKVPLQNYGGNQQDMSQFAASNALGSGSGGPSFGGLANQNQLGATLEERMQQSLGPQDGRLREIAKTGRDPRTGASIFQKRPQLEGQILEEKVIDDEDPFGLRPELQEIFDRLNDQEAAEERIARARAAQSAGVRAAMGAGETGMSGAAALLEGEAGRLAESQARAAELAQDLDVAALGSALMNFDMTKQRYTDAEKQNASAAVMYLMQAYDVDYDEAFEMLGLPESAKSDSQRKTVNAWGESLNEDEDDKGDSDKERGEGVEIGDDGSFVLEEGSISIDDYVQNGTQVEAYQVDDSWTETGSTDWGEDEQGSNRKYKFYTDEDGNKYYVVYTRVPA